MKGTAVLCVLAALSVCAVCVCSSGAPVRLRWGPVGLQEGDGAAPVSPPPSLSSPALFLLRMHPASTPSAAIASQIQLFLGLVRPSLLISLHLS